MKLTNVNKNSTSENEAAAAATAGSLQEGMSVCQFVCRIESGATKRTGEVG